MTPISIMARTDGGLEWLLREAETSSPSFFLPRLGRAKDRDLCIARARHPTDTGWRSRRRWRTGIGSPRQQAGRETKALPRGGAYRDWSLGGV